MLAIQDLSPGDAQGIRAVLFDIDDTITKDGLLLEEAYSAIWSLHRAGIACVPVTGRPAGWCDLIARQWPVAGVVGENGAFAYYMREGKLERFFHPAAPEFQETRLALEALGREALEAFPGLRIAKDQAYRLYDLALDFAEEAPDLGLGLAARVRDFCEAAGTHAKVSSIHVNAWFGDYDKLSCAELFLSRILGIDPIVSPRAIIFFGDSPNDEPMFKRFPLTCGVANVLRYEGLLKSPPTYITKTPFGYGFAEGCSVLLNLLEGR